MYGQSAPALPWCGDHARARDARGRSSSTSR